MIMIYNQYKYDKGFLHTDQNIFLAYHIWQKSMSIINTDKFGDKSNIITIPSYHDVFPFSKFPLQSAPEKAQFWQNRQRL